IDMPRGPSSRRRSSVAFIPSRSTRGLFSLADAPSPGRKGAGKRAARRGDPHALARKRLDRPRCSESLQSDATATLGEPYVALHRSQGGQTCDGSPVVRGSRAPDWARVPFSIILAAAPMHCGNLRQAYALRSIGERLLNVARTTLRNGHSCAPSLESQKAPA